MPSIGRRLSRDPIGEMGGINLYGYVGNNSINAIDPLGLIGWGFVGNASGTLGLGWGGSASASAGIGAFLGPNPNGSVASIGTYAGVAAAAGAAHLGASGGAGGGLFFTSANCAEEMSKMTDTITLDLGALGLDLGLSISWGGGVFNVEGISGATPLPVTGSVSWISTSHDLGGPAVNSTVGHTLRTGGR